MYSRVYVEITNICNMDCSFCHGHTRQPRRMQREEFARILQQLTGQTQYIYYHLMGEPLTHPELTEFLKMAAQSGFRSIITTNGTLLGKRGDEIIHSGVHKVNISLHSFEQDDDEGYLRYMHQAADFADKAAKAGIIVVFRLWNRGHDNGRNNLAEAFLHTRFAGEWAPNSRGFRIRNRLFLEWGDRFQWPDKDAPVQGSQVTCYGLKDHFGILCDGSVVPCCMDSDGIITLGNVFTVELTDILASARARAMSAGFQRRTATEDLCRRCAYATRFL